MANIIDITIRANDETGAGVSSASKSANVLQGIFQGIGQKAAGMLAELPGQAIEFFKGAIDAASDLGETVSKNQTIFGAASKGLLEWAEDAPKALGMTRNAALEATGTLGNMFTQLGIGAEKAAAMSEANVKLASDFASFHNADPTDVLEAMTAAYRGEYDAVQRFVPTLNAAAVEQEALTETHKASKDALTDQDKALAVNTLMMKGAGAAAGDFARTSDSAANRSRIAAASFEEIKVKIGNVLLPAWTMLLGFITGQFFPALTALGDKIGSIVAPAFQMASDAVKLFIGAFTGEGAEVGSLTGEWINRIIDLGAQAARIFAAIKDAWSLLTTGFTENELDTNLGDLGPKVKEVADIIRNFVTQIPGWFESAKSAVGGFVEAAAPFWEQIKGNQNLLITAAYILGTALVAAFIALAAAAWSAAAGVIAATWPFLAIIAVIFGVVTALRYAYDNWSWFRDGVNAVVQFLITNVPPAFELIRAGIAVAVEWITGVAVPWLTTAFGQFMGFLQGTLLPAVTNVWNGIQTVIATVVDIVMGIVGRLSSFISDNWNWIAGLAAAIWDQIRSIITNAWQIISNIVQLFLNIISGNWGAAWDNIKNIVSAATDMVIGTIANTARAVGNIFMLIVSLAGNMAGGILERLGDVVSFFAGLPGRIMGAIGSMASELFGAGQRAIQALIDGIKSKIGGAVSAVSDGLGQIRRLLPFSPAKEGPLSGRGYTLYSGQAMASSLAEGIRDRIGQVRRAATSLMHAANGATRSSPSFPGADMAAQAAAAYGGAGAGTTHNWYVQGSIRADRDLVRLVRDELNQLGLVPIEPRR